MSKKLEAVESNVDQEISAGEVETDDVNAGEIKEVDTLPVAWAGSNVPALADTEGALEENDILIPKLNLVQRVGDLSIQFPQGSWILNQETQLTQKLEDSLVVSILRTPRKYFQERMVFDPEGPRPRRFNTLQEVLDAGLSTKWEGDVPSTAEPVAEIYLLIKAPTALKDSPAFAQEIEGIGQYTVARWIVLRTAYTRAAKRIFTAIALEIGVRPIISLSWQLIAVPEKIKGYNVFTPKLTSLGFWPEKTLNALRERFNN